MAVKSASRISSIYGGNQDIAIVVEVNNPGSSPAQLSLSSFKLTDASHNKYQSLREQQSSESDYNYVLSILNLPKGHTVLTNQTLNKNETVSGILIFYANNSISNFTLSYEGTSYPISL